ncbi:NUDIX domain-containing protein [bacterium]|jgi:ADP-ribose pyrophosphatase YjhB (NUDIX family)|nr:NUDIX domain-containing protein [bacterium]
MEVKKTRIAGGVVINEFDEIIVVSQKGKIKTWSLPKGHIEEGETELEAAFREVYEESGAKDLEFIKPLGTYERYSMDNGTELKIRTFFLFKTLKQKLNPIDEKNPEAIWIYKDKVSETLTHPKDKEFFSRVLTKI